MKPSADLRETAARTIPGVYDMAQTVLIVDDDEMLLDAVASGLSLKGFQCEKASSVKSALALLRKTPFDMMVTDVILPDGHGFDLTRKAVKLNPSMNVILMTGYSDDFSYDEAIEAGASDFIKKPFSASELLARIKHIVLQEPGTQDDGTEERN